MSDKINRGGETVCEHMNNPIDCQECRKNRLGYPACEIIEPYGDVVLNTDRKKVVSDKINPKDALGASKISITKFPMVALLHGSHAFMNGAERYGSYNWREKDVKASIYVDAAMRHLGSWFEREETAEDSGVHHLGHALACIALLLDAQEGGNLIDDRPPTGLNDFAAVAARLNALVKSKLEKK